MAISWRFRADLAVFWGFTGDLNGNYGTMWEHVGTILFTGDLLNQWDFYWIEPPIRFFLFVEWELVVSIAIVWGPGGSKMSSISINYEV